MKKITALLLTLLLTAASFTVAVSADTADKTVTLRIEGIQGTLYEGTVQTSGATVEEVLKDADKASDKLDITITASTYGAYVSAVNSETEATFGGYDGWMFQVNNVASNVGISAATVADKDTIVLYYSDAFGAGFQYPVADTSKIDKGIIAFTSMDTTYDANYNPIVTKNPVADMKVTWYTGADSTSYVTDSKGQITIPVKYLTKGDHKITVEKKSDKGVPMVLRFPSNQAITLAEDVVTDVKGGDSNLVWLYAVLLSVTAAVLVKGRNKAYEN